MTVIAGLVVFFGTYIAFSIIFYFYPWSESEDNWLTGVDFIILSALIFIALIVAAIASVRLTRRILQPLELCPQRKTHQGRRSFGARPAG